MRDQMRNMQANETMQQPREASSKASAKNDKVNSGVSKDSEYIDFEEIK